MRVWFVGAGPGDPELLTVKADRLLREARCCIYAGSLISPAVVARLPEECETHDSAGMTLEEVLAVIGRCREAETDVVRLHTGDPALYGAIAEQMDALDARGIPYAVVPGVSSFQAAAAALRTELTAPEVAQTVILSRAAGRTPVPAREALSNLARVGGTVCLFLSVDRIETVCETLAEEHGADCPAAAVYHASWPDEAVVQGTLADLPPRVREAGIAKTAMIVVGRALARGAARSKLYDPAFAHGYRESAAERDDSAKEGGP